MDEKPPRKTSTYRDRYYAKYRFKRPQRTRPPATAQDWASGSLAEHDARFHPDGYRPEEGERCSLRDARLSGVGYDGFIISNLSAEGPFGNGYTGEVTDYIAFKPGSIKLSDVVTFDDSGNVIPLSRRFDFSNPDIRY